MEGYALNPVHLIPQEVTISGPKSIIEKTIDIKTKSIVLEKEYVEDFDCSAEIDNKRNISVSPKTVSARIEIYKKYDIREFRNLTIKPFGHLPGAEKLEINPIYSSVSVEGVKNAVEIITSEQIRPFVDISEIDEPGEYTLNVQCWLNNKELSVKEIKPATVNVKVSR